MRTTIKNLILPALIAVALSSCQKEVDYVELGDNPGNPNNPNDPNNPPGNPPDRSLIGTWNLVKVVGTSQNTVDAEVQGQKLKNVSSMYLDSRSAGGTSVFDETTITTNDIIFEGMATVTSITTLDGMAGPPVTVEMEMPGIASSGSGKYKKVGTDSIYIEGGIISLETQPGAPVVSAPSGARISWSGDTLVMWMRVNQSQTIDMGGGIPATVTVNLDYKYKFLKP